MKLVLGHSPILATKRLVLGAGAMLVLCGGLACQSEENTVGVVLETALGEIEVLVYPDRAPISANNFLAWVAGGHYEGATFYRVTRPDNTTGPNPIQVVQGGLLGEVLRRGESSPPGGGPIPPIAHETTDTTGIPNERGTIAYARLEPGTADSEFFFNVADNPALDTGNTTRQPDGQGYATFGHVVRGMEVLEEIQGLPTLTEAGSEVTRGQMLEQPVVIRQARVLDD
ncbi:MAG: peptidylprolyl isomerase [Acidobacteriota bacterium]|nr:peptidylprolyl isomerase [Acidobacteriota bacterium]